MPIVLCHHQQQKGHLTALYCEGQQKCRLISNFKMRCWPCETAVRLLLTVAALVWCCSLSSAETAAIPSTEESPNIKTPQNRTDKLPITIYYEALCSDSMVFITNQLYPSWLRRENEMLLRFVPFGKAWIEERPDEPAKFHCQHGPRECELNVLHGCILKKMPPKKAFAVVACLMKNFRTRFEQVCMEGHESYKDGIVQCSQGPKGEKLFKKFANETTAVHQPLPFVPTVVDDQPYNFYEQDDWLEHFDRKFVERYEAKFGVKI
uniref:Gamma-interferon-inducible lysosomal thiol reductase n=1 Tax=Anopheles farauti TaxID=69004 RepID=A0A182QX00_9DIPT